MLLKNILIKRKLHLIIIFTFLFSGLAVKVHFSPIYEAETLIMLDIKQSPSSVANFRLNINEMTSLIRTNMTLLKNTTVILAVIKDLGLCEDDSGSKHEIEKKIREKVNLLRKCITVSSPPFTNLINITIKYNDPKKVSQIANALVKNYKDWRCKLLTIEANRLSHLLDMEIDSVKDKLLLYEDALIKHKADKTNITKTNSEIELSVDSLSREIEIREKIYETLIGEKENLNMLKSNNIAENIEVVSPAEIPLNQSDKMKRILKCAFFCFFISIICAYALEYRKQINSLLK